MPATKTNKSFAKRLKVTKTGKVIQRRPGQNHFRAKVRSKDELARKRTQRFRIDKKHLGQYLPFS